MDGILQFKYNNKKFASIINEIVKTISWHYRSITEFDTLKIVSNLGLAIDGKCISKL